MITGVSANMLRSKLPGQWVQIETSMPESGKWVLIRTGSYQRIARLENGVWRTVDGKEETRPVISWQEI